MKDVFEKWECKSPVDGDYKILTNFNSPSML